MIPEQIASVKSISQLEEIELDIPFGRASLSFVDSVKPACVKQFRYSYTRVHVAY